MSLETMIDQLRPLLAFVHFLENPEEFKAQVKAVQKAVEEHAKVMKIYPTVAAADARLNEVNKLAEMTQAELALRAQQLVDDRSAYEAQRQERDAKISERELACSRREGLIVEAEKVLKKDRADYERLLIDLDARERDFATRQAAAEAALAERVAKIAEAVKI
jgi:hypothetical protein